MSIGESGRIVVEIDPALKQALHARLRRDGTYFKEWLVRRIDEYLGGGSTELGPQSTEPKEELNEPIEELSEEESSVLAAMTPERSWLAEELMPPTGLSLTTVSVALVGLMTKGEIEDWWGSWRRVKRR